MATKLPFTQGYEVELQLVNAKGEILAGEKLLSSWEKMFNKAADLLKNIKSQAPGGIANKINAVEVKNKDRHGKQIKYVTIAYNLAGKSIEVDAFGPDPNISQITWILELVTPPCEEMEELGWWLSTLYSVAVQSVPSDVKIHSTGFNGVETEYRSGVTFGDHIHIGVPDQGERIKVYNMLRAFVPHLISLTVNSPFINEMPVGDIIVKNVPQLQVLPKESTRSLRLHYNKGQMGPPDKDHYIPYLNSYDQKAFDRVVAREPPDDRYVDMFPFTAYGTIELRFFDAQFSVARRLALTGLIQALAFNAIHKSSQIPNVQAEILVNNREKAIEYGLVGKFFPDETLDAAIASFYNLSALTEKKSGKLFQAAQSIIYQLWDTITELKFEDFLQPVLVSAFGTDKLAPPLSPADFLLYKYKLSGDKYSKVLADLTSFTETCCTVIDKDPIVEAFGRVDPNKIFAHNGASEEYADQTQVASAETLGGLEPTASPVKSISYEGNLKLGTKEFFPERPLPFEANLHTTGIPMGDGTVVLKIVEIVKGTERVVQTAIKKIPLGPNLSISSKDISLQIPYSAFQGSKQCQLSLEIKDDNGVPLIKTQAGPFQVWGTPEISIKIVGGLENKVKPDIDYELTVNVINQTPKFGGDHKLKLLVLDSLKQPLFTGDKEFKLTPQSVHKFIINFDRQVTRADFVTYRFQVLNADKIISEYESDRVEILKEPEELVLKTQKPKVQVSVPKPIAAPAPPSNGFAPVNRPVAIQPKVIPPQVTAGGGGKNKFQPSPKSSLQPKIKSEPKGKPNVSKNPRGKPQPQGGKNPQPYTSKNQPSQQVPSPSKKGKVSPPVVPKRAPPSPVVPGKEEKIKPKPPAVTPSPKKPVVTKQQDRKSQPQRTPSPAPRVTPPRPPASMKGSSPLTTRSVARKLKITGDTKKASYFLGDSVKTTFNIGKDNPAESLSNLSYRTYFIANNGKNYLVKSGEFSLNSSKNISVGFKIGKPFPLTDAFKVGIVVEHLDQLIGEYSTDPISVENKKIESLIRVTRISNVANQIHSNGSLVPIFTFQTINLVRPTPLVIRLTLEDNDEKVFSSTSTFVEVTESNTYNVPASITCKKVPPDVSDVVFRTQVAIQGGLLLFEKKFKIPYARFESDLVFLQLGPKAPEVSVGEEILSFCSINNPSDSEYRGKIDLWFYPQKITPIKFYSRKLRVSANDRYDFVERTPAPPSILGNAVQVLADMKVTAKAKKVTFQQYYLGETVFRVNVPQRLPINVSVRTDNTSMRTTPGQVLPVEVEVKANQDLPAMTFNLLESFENIEIKKIGSGKLKKKQPIQVFNFHWKVPKKIGICGLEIEMFEDNKPIDPRLINYKHISFNIVK